MHTHLPLSARTFRALAVVLLALAAPLAKADTAPEPAPPAAPEPAHQPHRDLIIGEKHWSWAVYGDAVVVEGELRNTSTTETYRMIRLTAEVYDKQMRVLGQPAGSISELGPGKVWKFKLFDGAGYRGGKKAKFIRLDAQ